MIALWELKATYEFESKTVSPDDVLKFRVEIFQRSNGARKAKSFRIRAYRYDLFRVKPSGTRNSEILADSEWPIIDDTFDQKELVAKSIKDAVRETLKSYSNQLSVKIEL